MTEDIEDITLWREDMNFMLSGKNNILFMPREHKIHIFELTLHTAGAREIWIDQSGFSRRKKAVIVSFR